MRVRGVRDTKREGVERGKAIIGFSHIFFEKGWMEKKRRWPKKISTFFQCDNNNNNHFI